MRWLLLLLLLAGLGFTFWKLRDSGPESPPEAPPAAPGPTAKVADAPRPPVARAPAFVGSESCRECHEERHETWLRTGHAYSLRSPAEGSVEGRFDGQPVESRFFRATPYRSEGEYYIRVEGRDGRPSGDYRVSRVVGRTFEQAYLFTGPHGEWRVLPICWSIERGEWDLTHEILEDIAGAVGAIPEDYDTRNHIFNHGCGQCHATDYDVGHNIEPGKPSTYDSTFLEGAVACESCHGPGSEHAAWHGREPPPAAPYEAPARLLHPAKDLDAEGVLHTCGRCHYLHEWRYAIDDDPRVSYHDIAVSLNYDGPGFFADGRLSGLNYHGSTQRQSACYLQGGMSCLDCHSMHSGRPRAMKFPGDSDAQCTQCHAEQAEQGAAHTFHENEEIRCVDCHMARFLGGPLHSLRDHRIRCPEPELTERFGADQVPNACNVCHADETAGWAREWKEKWFDPAPRRLVDDVDLAVRLRRKPGEVTTAELAETAGRAESDLFFRMTATRELVARIAEPEAQAALRRLLHDPEVEIVQTVCEAFGQVPDPDSGARLLELVEHPVRTVRVAAGYALARAGWRGSTPAFDRVWEDALLALKRQRQYVETLLRIAILADAVERPEQLEIHFRQLVRLAQPSQWTPTATELVHRRARWLTENRTHDDALLAYAQVHELAGEENLPLLLYVDSADSLAAVGRTPEALANWQVLTTLTEPGTVLDVLARARIAFHSGQEDLEQRVQELERVAAELEEEPCGGQLLLRVRWSLDRIRDG